ncbi:sporulation integral membrane protein YtvI [Bacillota bacterium LX-D]|nr:sporulation integral membrane protein YtvI [Bacillota bacterium LX-D]
MKDISPKLLKLFFKTIFALVILLIALITYYYIIPALKGVFNYTTPIVLPFIIAIIIAALIDPVVDYLEHHFKLSRGASVLIALTFFIGIVIAGFTWIAIRLILELIELSSYLPQLSDRLSKFTLDLINKTTDFYFSLSIPQNVLDNATANVQKIVNQLTAFAGHLLTSTFTFISAIPEGMLLVIFALIATYFFCRDKTKIRKAMYKLFPLRTSKLLDSVGREITIAMIGFIRAQFVLITITFIQTLVGLYILKVEYALTIALFVGIADLLPVLGPGAIFIPWIIWELLNGNYGLLIGLVILYVFITVVRNLLQPKVLSDNVGMHPLEALVSIYVGLKVFGVLGVILGPIFWVALKAIWRGWNEVAKIK